MNALKVTPEKLKNESQQFLTTAGKINNITNNMLSTIKTISETTWGGEASAQYKTKFAALEEPMKQLYDMVKEHSSIVDQVADEYIRVEKQNQNTAQTLKTDIF